MSELSCHFKIFIANIKMIPQKKTYMRRSILSLHYCLWIFLKRIIKLVISWQILKCLGKRNNVMSSENCLTKTVTPPK